MRSLLLLLCLAIAAVHTSRIQQSAGFTTLLEFDVDSSNPPTGIFAYSDAGALKRLAPYPQWADTISIAACVPQRTLYLFQDADVPQVAALNVDTGAISPPQSFADASINEVFNVVCLPPAPGAAAGASPQLVSVTSRAGAQSFTVDLLQNVGVQGQAISMKTLWKMSPDDGVFMNQVAGCPYATHLFVSTATERQGLLSVRVDGSGHSYANCTVSLAQGADSVGWSAKYGLMVAPFPMGDKGLWALDPDTCALTKQAALGKDLEALSFDTFATNVAGDTAYLAQVDPKTNPTSFYLQVQPLGLPATVKPQHLALNTSYVFPAWFPIA